MTTPTTMKNGKTSMETTMTARRRLNFDPPPVHTVLTNAESQLVAAVNMCRELSTAGATTSELKETGKDMEMKTKTETKTETDTDTRTDVEMETEIELKLDPTTNDQRSTER